MAIALAGAVYPLPNAPALYSIYAIIILMARCASESNLTRRQSARGFPQEQLILPEIAALWTLSSGWVDIPNQEPPRSMAQSGKDD